MQFKASVAVTSSALLVVRASKTSPVRCAEKNYLNQVHLLLPER